MKSRETAISRFALGAVPLAALMSLMPAASVHAQSQPSASGNQPSAVIEITAQKRKEKAQDVPLPVTAINAEDLELRGIEAANDMVGTVPTLNMTTAPGAGLIAAVGMRGLASGQPAIWADPAVGIYVDGVFVGKNQGALFDMVDIARLEALRGPQGTLFGRNTAAGAINFVTRKPSGVFGGSAQMEVGNFGRVVGRLGVDLPKTGIFSASVSVRSEKQDGFVASSGPEAFGSKDRSSGRLAVRAEPSKNLTIDYAFDYTDIHEMPPVNSLTYSRGYGELYPLTTAIGGNNFAFQNAGCLQRNAAGACVFPTPGIGPAIRPFANPNYPTSIANGTNLGDLYQKLRLNGHALQAEYQLSKTDTLRYIGAVRKMVYGDATDLDQTSVFVFSNVRDTTYETQSHELQWVGSSGNLRYVVGLYHFTDEGTQTSKQAGGLLTFHPNVASYQMANFDISTKAQAVFGQLDFDVGPVSVGVGGRFTEETKKVYSYRYRTNNAFVQQGANTVDLRGESTWSAFTPTVNVLYRLNKDTNLFARVSKGFKSGGFPAEAPVTASSAPNKPFDPEKVTAYELGIKGNLDGGRFSYSANLFRMDVSNYQISLLPAGSISPTIVNAAKLQNQGLELDATWVPNDSLKMTLALGLLESKYKSFASLSATNVVIDAANNTVVSGAPKMTLSLSTNAKLTTINNMPLRGIVDIRHVAERYTYPGVIDATKANAPVGNSAAESLMPALTMVDLKLLLGSIRLGGPGDAEVSLFVKNATNQRKPIAHVDISGFYQMHTWSDPRTYGATFTYRW